ncbi:MAG: helix-turn-helix domain-containing protein [Clostridiales bacterium]|nr:helix-turn-helix domain-containing protein [Clostridiales bacterium]
MLCKNLKIIRKNKGYSQEELAERIHVTRQTVSKWENGQSLPDAEMVKSIAEVFGVSVSELLEGDAEKIVENEVIIDQLARINEQLIINNRKTEKKNRTFIAAFVAVLLVIALVSGIFLLKEKRERGYRVRKSEHIAVLTFSLPHSVPHKVFYHAEGDVGLTCDRDGNCRISAKIYRNYHDMTEISIYEMGAYNPESIEGFKEKYPDATESLLLENSRLPEGSEHFVAATDERRGKDGHRGTYYRAYIVFEGKMYYISVLNGDYVLDNGEFVISSMAIDKTQEEEYRSINQ